jgi:hypothetical protein
MLGPPSADRIQAPAQFARSAAAVLQRCRLIYIEVIGAKCLFERRQRALIEQSRGCEIAGFFVE